METLYEVRRANKKNALDALKRYSVWAGRGGGGKSHLSCPSAGLPTRKPVSVDAAQLPVMSGTTVMAPLWGMLTLRPPPPREALIASGGIARLTPAGPATPLASCRRDVRAAVPPSDRPKGDGTLVGAGPDAEESRETAVAGDALKGGRGGSACCAGEVPSARWMAVCAMGSEEVRKPE